MALFIRDAAMDGNLEEVMRLIEEDPEIVDSTDEIDQSALHCASFEGHVEVVPYLLDQGANIDKKGFNGGTAVTWVI